MKAIQTFNASGVAVTLKRYVAVVKMGGAIGKAEFVDWFTDDADAANMFRVIMAEQGYKVLGVTIGDPCIVEVE